MHSLHRQSQRWVRALLMLTIAAFSLTLLTDVSRSQSSPIAQLNPPPDDDFGDDGDFGDDDFGDDDFGDDGDLGDDDFGDDGDFDDGFDDGVEDTGPFFKGTDDTVVIPRSTALVVSFPSDIQLDPKRQHDFPITLPLARPIVDNKGNIAIPARTLVSAYLRSMEGGDVIEARAVIIGGRVIPVNAIGTLLPAQVRPDEFGNQFISSPGRASNTLRELQLANPDAEFDGIYDGNNTARDLASIALAIGVGLSEPTPQDPPPFVNIEQGTLHVLTLAAPVKVPKVLVESGFQIQRDSEDDEFGGSSFDDF